MAPAFDILAFLVIALLALACAYGIHRLVIGGREIRKFSGKMLVTCPETHETVAVKVATGKAAIAAIWGTRHVELSQCTRWPERQDCDQACLAELQVHPADHRVWKLASDWYQGKTCIFCGRPIAELSHLDHSPGLVSFEGKIVEWDRLSAEDLPEELVKGQPVCWNCTVVEAFRKEHPELTIDRPWKH
jgi:hypothetical protein